LHKWHL